MRYLVRAIQNNQDIVALSLEAANQTEAESFVRTKGLTVLSSSKEKSGLKEIITNSGSFDLVLFSQELLALIDAGISLVEAMETLTEKQHRSDARRILTEVVDYLHEGLSLSVALQRLPDAFPPLFIATVRASERTGGLAEGLSRYIIYANQLNIVRKKIISASIYPLLLIGMGTLVMIFLLLYIVPKFAKIYEDLGSHLPFLSSLLLRWGAFVEQHAVMLAVIVVVSSVGGFHAITHTSIKQYVFDRLWAIPMLGEQLKIYQLARFYRTLGMLLRGGIQISAALDMVGGLLQPAFQKNLKSAIYAIREGKSISIAFDANHLTTPVATRMLRVGERSGRMGEMMERIAAFYDEDIARWIDWFTRLFEPVLMAFIGIAIGAIVVLMYLPIFELAGGIQ